MKQFLMFNSLGQPILRNSFQSLAYDNPLQVSVVEYYSAARAARLHLGGYDQYFFGMMDLRKEYPIAFISRETLVQRVVDLFVKGATNFPNSKKFSSRFHVVTDEKENLQYLLRDKPLDELLPFRDMEAELNKNACLFRLSRKPLSEEEALQFVKLTKIMQKIFL